jgi:hypothetical protein
MPLNFLSEKKNVPNRNHYNFSRHFYGVKVKKGKAIPVTSRGGPWGCETLRLPHFL